MKTIRIIWFAGLSFLSSGLLQGVCEGFLFFFTGFDRVELGFVRAKCSISETPGSDRDAAARRSLRTVNLASGGSPPDGLPHLLLFRKKKIKTNASAGKRDPTWKYWQRKGNRQNVSRMKRTRARPSNKQLPDGFSLNRTFRADWFAFYICSGRTRWHARCWWTIPNERWRLTGHIRLTRIKAKRKIHGAWITRDSLIWCFGSGLRVYTAIIAVSPRFSVSYGVSLEGSVFFFLDFIDSDELFLDQLDCFSHRFILQMLTRGESFFNEFILAS